MQRGRDQEFGRTVKNKTEQDNRWSRALEGRGMDWDLDREELALERRWDTFPSEAGKKIIGGIINHLDVE